MSKVAWIGLGVMGYPLAGHLKTRGHHDVAVFNRTRQKAERWVTEFGGSVAATPAEDADGAEFVFTCVGKDFSICFDEARRNGASLPVTALVDQFYADVQEMGGSRWDTSSMIARLERK